MEALHLTYDEVFSKIPYRNLVLMQKDKLRICYGEKLEMSTPQEMGIIFNG